jgi:choline dehydrogenase-like flavoprotein
MGNVGWNWESLSPFLIKFHALARPSEDTSTHLGLDWIDDAFHNDHGPVKASFAGVVEDLIAKAWVETLKTLNHPTTEDQFAGKATGGFANPTTIYPDSKTRCYSASAYYQPASGRANLHVLTGAAVQCIIFSQTCDGLVATGVNFVQDGQDRTVIATKEVILAAGALQSPKILELSGIGSAKVLESLGIAVQIPNTYVGENLQDHILTGISFEVVDGIYTGDDMLRGNAEAIQQAMEAYQTFRKGPLCNPGVSSFAFVPTTAFHTAEGRSELQKTLDDYKPELPHPAQHLRHKILTRLLSESLEPSSSFFTFGAQTNVGRSLDLIPYNNNPLEGNYLTIACALLHPLSTGSVHIASAVPSEPPVIDPEYLSHRLDLEVMARHTQYLETIATTEPLASLLKPDGRRNASGAYVSDLDAAKDYARSACVSNWHAVGTCAMLPREMGGVVDPTLIVYGTTNLRVVDASIMPSIPQCNTQSVVYAVAERAAGLIKSSN